MTCWILVWFIPKHSNQNQNAFMHDSRVSYSGKKCSWWKLKRANRSWRLHTLKPKIYLSIWKKCSKNQLTYSDGNQSQQWWNSGAAVSVQVHHLIVIIDILYTLVFCYVVQSLKPAFFIVCKSTKKLQKSSKPANWLEPFCFNPLSGRLEKILLIVLTMHYTNKQKKRSLVTQEVAGQLKKLL